MQALDQAKMFHQMGRVAEAEAAYRAVLARNPREFDALHLLGLLRYQQGRADEAHQLLKEAVKLKPRSPQALTLLMAALIALGRLPEALNACDRIIETQPSDLNALYNRAILLSRLRRFEAALAAFDRFLARDRDNVDALFERGNTLAALARFDEAAGAYGAVLRKAPAHLGALTNSGNALTALGRHAEALASYDCVLAIQPNDVNVLANRAAALRQLGREEEALACYTRAVTLDPRHWNSLFNRGNILLALDRAADALASYEAAGAVAPPHADVYVGKGNALLRLNRIPDALDSYERALAVMPGHRDALLSQGNALLKCGHMTEAMAAYEQGVARYPDDASLLAGRAGVHARTGQFDAAIRDYEQVLRTTPDDAVALSGLCNALLEVCDWDRIAARKPALEALVGRKESVPPLLVVRASDDPALQLESARNYVAAMAPTRSRPQEARADRPDKIRIAYLSADFRHHPIAYLIAGLIERHDRARFEVTGMSFGLDDRSDIRARLIGGFDRFEDAAQQSDQDAAARLQDLQIDIAIDLTGHTLGARPGILARRPAPISVNFLGYPGTMGAEFIDYMIADRIVAPFDQQNDFTEKLVHLPECFFLSGVKDEPSVAVPTRAQAGLPERGFVFCCFNNSYKLSAPVFQVWLRLLARVEDSVLWLSQLNSGAVANLCGAAQAGGIDPRRIVFAPRVSSTADHFARHQLADLFLDTLPYNAHSTANDALWAGLPVLTCAGHAFAGRVTASMLHAMDLPDLVTGSLDEYERRATALAIEPGLLSDIRRRLRANPRATPLFDLDRYCRHLETAYLTMWERHGRGESPEAFGVPALDAR